MKKLVSLLLVLLVFTGTASAADLSPDVRSAILVDAASGKILYQENIDTPMPPASMTKMMTEYLVLEAIKDKTITWDDIVTTSDYGFFLGRYGGSRVFLNEKERRTVRELYEAMAIYSANDATAMLAEHIASTETAFVELMNEKGQELGMKDSNFITSTGLPRNILSDYAPPISLGEQVMSARDAAILARELINTFPEALKIASTPKAVFRQGEDDQVEMINWNWMLPGLWYELEGVDGLKTGYTEAAGNCFTGTAKRGNIRLISVVMGAKSKEHRFKATKELLEYGFEAFTVEKIAKKGDTIKGYEKTKVLKGKKLEVPVEVAEDISLMVKRDSKIEKVVSLTTVEAPVKKGQVIGSVAFDSESDYLREKDKQDTEINMVAVEEIEKASLIIRLFRGIKNFFLGLF
ncbi:D-alanyl-D-alanine carboxypeptidase [Metallumcola ferriviriculae]|uniref:serine-type D-Ala-D-Ala carboxypeptidase n=1 Tax=Metallumcola ferriviriculae TaxID=3039180 RepID=A0AAU0UTI8_9FIRM|nr:D-alanyl-D-alanine carboxypeptidase [Desulfitibacteraceae bacterium MK1]